MTNARTCPICGEALPATDFDGASFFPFCSRKCQQRDLGRWLGEKYRIARRLDVVPEDSEIE